MAIRSAAGDVVFYDAGTWSLFYDASDHGLGATNLNAISVVAGTLVLLDGKQPRSARCWPGPVATIPTSTAGTVGHPTPGSSMRPVLVRSTGRPANVDGLVWVDATHLYLSYTADTTVPGLGAVQDEDVVYYNAGTWSVYFDGTSRLLTANGADIDAFDLP